MSLTLTVDGARWQAHLHTTLQALPGLVPVIKGNGYGFGLERLAAAAAGLGVATVAVGEPRELAAVRAAFPGDVLVLSPWRAEWAGAYDENPRVIRTVSHLDALHAIAGTGARVVVECLTSMRRHGIAASEIAAVRPLLDGVRMEGFALHLPLDRPHGTADDVTEVAAWIEALRAVGLPTDSLWLSHVTRDELSTLRARFPEVTFRPRVGTALWLGDPKAYEARATVLDVRPLAAGERCGYRQHKLRRPATLLVVSGGTTQGIGLEAPTSATRMRTRVKLLGAASLASVGRNLSPFRVAGCKRWYAEPPHMQVSLVLLPSSVEPPSIGARLSVDVRMTTTNFDRVEGW